MAWASRTRSSGPGCARSRSADLGGVRKVELRAAAGANLNVELLDLSAARTAALRLFFLRPVQDHPDQPEDGQHRPHREPDEERAPLRAPDHRRRDAEENRDQRVFPARHRYSSGRWLPPRAYSALRSGRGCPIEPTSATSRRKGSPTVQSTTARTL